MQQNQNEQIVAQFIHSYSNNFILNMQNFRGWKQFLPLINIKCLVNGNLQSINNIIKILIKQSKTQIATPGELYYKPLTLLILYQLIRNVKKNSFQNKLSKQQINQIMKSVEQQFLYNDYEIDSILVAKLYTNILLTTFGSKYDYSRYSNELVLKQQNVNCYLVKMIAIYQSSKYYFLDDYKTDGVHFYFHSFTLVCDILKKSMNKQLIPTYLCCKLMSHVWGFPSAAQIFGKYENHQTWLKIVIQILKSKWYVDNVNQKYKNKQSVESIYLHTKKYGYKILCGFLKRCLFYKKTGYNNINLSQHLNKYLNFINQIIQETMSQIEYQCYPSKLKIQQIKIITAINRSKPQYFLQQQYIKKMLQIIIRYIALTPQDEEQMIKNPYESWLKNNDNISYQKNLRMSATIIWIQISFPRGSKGKGKKQKKSVQNNQQQMATKWKSQHNSLVYLNSLLDSNNLIECEASLYILGNIQFKYTQFFKSKLAETIIIQQTLPKLIKLSSSNAIMIKNSAFRAISSIIKGNYIQKLNQQLFTNLALISYQHLTKDQSILVRVNAGLTFMKLSLSQRNNQHFKLVMYECIIVLLNIMQEIVIQEIALLIIQVLKNQIYFQAALPLAKQLFIFGCNSLIQIYKGIPQNQQQQQQMQQDGQKYLVIESCSQIICMLLPNINSNELKPNNIIQKKIFQILQLIKTENKYSYQIKQSIFKICARTLQYMSQINQQLYQLIINLYQNILIEQKNYQLLSNQTFLIFYTNLCKNVSKNHKNPINTKILLLIQQTLNVLKSNEQAGQFEQKYICYSYTLINITSNSILINNYPNQCMKLKNIVIQKIIQLIKIRNNGIYEIANKKWIVNITFLLSCGIVCHFQDIFNNLLCDSHNKKQILFLTFINNTYQNMQLRIKQKYSPLKVKMLIFNFCIQAMIKILNTYTNCSNIIFFDNDNNHQQNAPPSLSQNIIKINKKQLNNLLKLLIQYTKVQLSYGQKISQGLQTQNQVQMYQNNIDYNSNSIQNEDDNDNENNENVNANYNEQENYSSNQMENEECQQDGDCYNHMQYIDCLFDFSAIIPKIFEKQPQLVKLIDEQHINSLKDIMSKIQEFKSKNISLQDNLMSLMKSKSK